MARKRIALAALGLLSACAPFPEWAGMSTFISSPGHDAPAVFNFDWSLSGDRQVAPLQVFDDGHQTWLQFQPQQNVPAVFLQTTGGERPLIHTRRGDYVLVDGIGPRLRFRGGALSAQARRGTDDTPSPNDLPGLTRPNELSLDSPDASPIVDTAPGTTSDTARTLTERSFVPAIELAVPQPLDIVHVDAVPAPKPAFSVGMGDQNLRLALQRWAQQAQWTFSPEHWAVDVDIPVSGEAHFGGPFKSAVQDLLSATELAERPLQPCFYSNRVLRIVPYAQACSRATTVQAS